jgi:hypothetical protein
MMTASSGSRSQMKVTMHPSQAEVCCMVHWSQLMLNVLMG